MFTCGKKSEKAQQMLKEVVLALREGEKQPLGKLLWDRQKGGESRVADTTNQLN